MTKTIEATRSDEFTDVQPGLLDFHSVWQNRWLVTGCTLLSLAAGVAYVLFATPIYEAKARVLIQQDGLSFNRPDRTPL
ncbi:MAG: hypothetical protein IID46_09495, partial [Planctomycetes bacterium]|nr:hypothetical protein [Planctomycetota bacterium]